MMKFNESSLIEAVDHQTSAEVDGESVILDLEKGVYYGLDSVGALVWEQIQDPARVEEVVARITTEYDVSYDRCFDDVVALLQELEENDLITVEQ